MAVKTVNRHLDSLQHTQKGIGLKVEVEIVVGSIVGQEVDALVNSANTSLIMGSGVAAALLHEAGPEVEEEAVRHAPIFVGDVVVTSAGDLPAEYILHVAVVGDVEPDIYQCTRSVLEEAEALGVRSIAFPALGTGSAGIAPEESAEAMCEAIADYCQEMDPGFENVLIVLWDAEFFPIFEKALVRAQEEPGLDDED